MKSLPLADKSGVSLEQVEAALCTLRVPPVPGEYDLHKLIAGALDSAGIEYRHEVILGSRCRIDFLAGNVGIEVKKGRVGARLLREQAVRYLRFDEVNELLLVTGGMANLPGVLLGKRVKVFGLNRLWGVSLP